MAKHTFLRVLRALQRRAYRLSHLVAVKVLSFFDLVTILDDVLAQYSKRSNFFITWDLKFVDSILSKRNLGVVGANFYLANKLDSYRQAKTYPNPFGSDLAIVIQGPVIQENDRTNKIVMYYLTKFPEVRVIISTWNDTPPSHLECLQKLHNENRIQLVLNQTPGHPGLFNVNLQIESTRSGVSAIPENCSFAIKTRTDQLFVSPMFLQDLHTLWYTYGVNKGKARIVTTSLNSFAYRLYGATDMFHFGKTVTLREFWAQALDTRDLKELSVESENLKDEGIKCVAEVYLNTNFYKQRLNREPNFTLEDSLRFIAENFIIADHSPLGQVWFKNSNLEKRWSTARFPQKYYELSHLDWLGLQLGISNWHQYSSLVESKDFHLN